MFEGDKSRKDTLVEHGPASERSDNRPLRFDEFCRR